MTVYHNLKLLGFTLYTYATLQHRDCARPTEIHQRVKRLKGEVPLPFDRDEQYGNNLGMSDKPLTVKHVHRAETTQPRWTPG